MNTNRYVRLPLMALLATAFSFLLATPSFAAAQTVTTNNVFPISITVFVPCAAGGAGEFVDLSGNLHDLFHVTYDGSGGTHIDVHDNAQGVVGRGETTGAKYQGTGVTRFDEQFTAGGTIVDTSVNNFRIIGQGPGNNFLVHDNFHFTINSNGTVTSLHDNFSVECK